jgi:ABC-type antimicrobial peptide transport system permease subunit
MLFSWLNVRGRRVEMAVLRAMGLDSGKIFFMLTARSCVIGAMGAVAGLAVGALGATAASKALLHTAMAPSRHDPAIACAVIVCTPIAAILAGWVPALIAVGMDPAAILREE